MITVVNAWDNRVVSWRTQHVGHFSYNKYFYYFITIVVVIVVIIITIVCSLCLYVYFYKLLQNMVVVIKS